MPAGFMGKILHVDLTTGDLEISRPGEETYRRVLGGYGLGAWILLHRQPGGVDALGPRNLLGFVTGPLTGTRAFNAGRFAVVGKSPLTGGWGDSNCGGHLAPALKGSGHDAVFFRGISPRPVYFYLSPETAEIRDAGDLWGLDAFETEGRLQERHGEQAQVAAIGPAGENQSLIAGIVHEQGRLAGRCGLGAVMGAKRLKALVVEGDLRTPVADPAASAAVYRRYRAMLADNPMVDAFRDYGTTGGLKVQIEMGDTPIKNWKGTPGEDFPQSDAVSGERIADRERRKYACAQCVLVCGGWVDLPGQADEWTRKPEYETVAAFGPLLLIDDLDLIVRANDFCDRAGIDTISIGAAIALAMECYEKGLITQEDTGGLDLTWGNEAVLMPLLRQAVEREGFGALLADGPHHAAQRIGGDAGEFAMEIGREAIPMHDPRLRPGWATSYQIDATPAHHEQGGAHFGEGAWGIPDFDTPEFDRYTYTGKAVFQRQMSTLVHVVNASGLCKFIIHCLPISFVIDFLNAVTGSSYALEDLHTLGERIAVVRQVFNVREGITPGDMRMPDRARGKPPLPSGPLEGITIDDQTQIREYLELMDWDPVSGEPSPERLRALGLDELTVFLEK